MGLKASGIEPSVVISGFIESCRLVESLTRASTNALAGAVVAAAPLSVGLLYTGRLSKRFMTPQEGWLVFGCV